MVDLPGQGLGLLVQVFVLSPTAATHQGHQGGAQPEHLPQAVADQGAFGGIVDVGLNDKGVGPHGLGRFGNELMAFGDDQLVDLLDGFRADQRDVVADASPVESGLLVPVADAHDPPQSPMLFGQILELVVIEVAAEADGGQHEDLPVVHSLAAPLAAGVAVDIPGDHPENTIAQLGLAVDVLQGLKNGDDFVAAVEVQLHVEDRSAIEPRLAIEGFSHRYCSSKIGVCLFEIHVFLTHQARKRFHLR